MKIGISAAQGQTVGLFLSYISYCEKTMIEKKIILWQLQDYGIKPPSKSGIALRLRMVIFHNRSLAKV